jgi:hypothetical protein
MVLQHRDSNDILTIKLGKIFIYRIESMSSLGASQVHHKCIGVSLAETVVFLQGRNLFRVFLIGNFIHLIKPIRHGLAILFLYRRKV